MISPRTALAIAAFGAAHPDIKLTVPRTSNLVFDAYYESSHVQRELLRFVELDPQTWTVPPIKKTCITFDKIVLWMIVKSSMQTFHLVYDVVTDIGDTCTIESDVLNKRSVEIVAPFDRHVSEWVCGPEHVCSSPSLTTFSSFQAVPIPYETFDSATWETLAHRAHGRPPAFFR
jgi:hypothetical protein